MDDTLSVATLIDSTTSKIQQLQQAFSELESHRAITLNVKWKELEEHFHGLEKSLKRRFCELEDQKKEYETKASEARKILEKRGAAVVAKEHALLDRLQKKRDIALSALDEAVEKHKNAPPVEPSLVNSEMPDAIAEEKPPDTKNAAVDQEDVNTVVDQEDVNTSLEDIKPCSELAKLCKQMDSKGVHKFISDNRKNLAAIREEIPVALKASTNPARLVLDSLEDFYHMEGPAVDGKKDPSLLGLRRTCIMLMECLDQLLADPELVSVSNIISKAIKGDARAIAEKWKPMLDDLDVDASSGNSLEAHAFLQLLATFGIASHFDRDEISKLIPSVSHRRQTADLCRTLELSEKMPGVIGVLVNSGRPIDAINLAYAFELIEQFPPVTLLKSYLKEAKKASSSLKSGNASPTAQNEVTERELTALKAVIKCIEEHKLEDQYPVDPLHKRVLQLEKAKADKKRVVEATKPQPKRPRANGAGYVPRVTNIVPDKSFYARVSDRYVPPYLYERPYLYPGHTDNHSSSLLGSATYTLSSSHGGAYFGNGYQYQTPYLH